MGASILTTNASASALTINVNPSGGAGDAVIGQGTVAGTVNVNSNGGNILWSNNSTYMTFTASQTGVNNGGSNTQTLKALHYVLTTASTGTESIGTAARPIQTDDTNGANTVTLTAGTGGIYVV